MDFARLNYADSGSCADMFYATGLHIEDPFLWWEYQGKSFVTLSPLEIDRAKPVAKVTEVLPISEFIPKDAKDNSAAALIAGVVKAHSIPALKVPETFPAGLFQKLKEAGIAIEVSYEEFFPARRKKTEQDIVSLREALRVAELGMKRGIEVLKASQITARGELKWDRAALTSERLRAEMECEVLRNGGLPAGTIVAGGDQGCDPHERGHGVLRANEAIVLDIFPRHSKTRFFGDLTRTVVRGVASEALKKQYAAVQAGKAWVMTQLKPGASGAEIQKQLIARFAEQGYKTQQRNGRWEGMFHGVGHGLGLDLHESPRFAAVPLFAGFCVTIEPGLYYPGVGGVRLEDVVVIRENDVLNLTEFPEQLEL
jgi:Xaa-Pro aminopeptidase